MCQKAVGGYFASFAGVALTDFAWTRGRPGIFHSSEAVERGFCRNCGTPLSFRYVTRASIGVTLGSLDAPERVKPEKQFGIESRVSFFGDLDELEGHTTESSLAPDVREQVSSRQHPDHET
jgi:hypothetical protein